MAFTRSTDRSRSPGSPGEQRSLILRLGDRRFAVALASARGVMPWRQPTRLPGAPPVIAGLINVRGTIVTVVDLGLQLTGHSCSGDEASILLVMRRATIVGLAVDEVVDITAGGESAGAEPLDLDQLLSTLLASSEER